MCVCVCVLRFGVNQSCQSLFFFFFGQGQGQAGYSSTRVEWMFLVQPAVLRHATAGESEGVRVVCVRERDWCVRVCCVCGGRVKCGVRGQSIHMYTVDIL